jgi:hypothetical protein
MPPASDAGSSSCPLSLDQACGMAVVGQLSITRVGAADEPIELLDDASQCGDGHGWHSNGELSELCPETCALLVSSPGSLRLRLACPAIICE